jgi:hypothetical protein
VGHSTSRSLAFASQEEKRIASEREGLGFVVEGGEVTSAGGERLPSPYGAKKGDGDVPHRIEAATLGRNLFVDSLQQSQLGKLRIIQLMYRDLLVKSDIASVGLLAKRTCDSRFSRHYVPFVFL